MLTRKQKELLLLIRDRLAEDGVPPSFDEMKDALGLRSKSGIHRLITGLEERGFIKRLAHRARALEIVRLPESLETKVPKAAARKIRDASATTANGKILPSVPSAAVIATAAVSLPFYGRIAAGRPIEAINNSFDKFDIPVGLLSSKFGRGDAGDHYALEISGDSMIEAGIYDGDRVIIKKCDTAENGAIVVALVEEHEATLKYLERRGSQIALIPANKNYETRILPSSAIRVQGKLVGLIRRY